MLNIQLSSKNFFIRLFEFEVSFMHPIEVQLRWRQRLLPTLKQPYTCFR